MSLTRADIEAALIKRAGDLLTTAGLDGTTVNGTNADLGDPIAFALRQIGVTVATLTSPTDAEVAAASTATEGSTDQLLDLAEIRVLETVLQHILDLVNTEAGDPAMTILAKTDYYTDTWFYPVFQEASTAGAAVTSYRPVYIYGSVTAVLTQTTAATPCLTVTILFQP